MSQWNKKCSSCRAEINALAKVCRYCQQEQSSFSIIWGKIKVAIGLISIALLIYWIYSILPGNQDNSENNNDNNIDYVEPGGSD